MKNNQVKKVLQLFENCTAIIFDGTLVFPVVESKYNNIWVQVDDEIVDMGVTELEDSYFDNNYLYIPTTNDESHEIEFLQSMPISKTIPEAVVEIRSGLAEVALKDRGFQLTIQDYDVDGLLGQYKDEIYDENEKV